MPGHEFLKPHSKEEAAWNMKKRQEEGLLPLSNMNSKAITEGPFDLFLQNYKTRRTFRSLSAKLQKQAPFSARTEQERHRQHMKEVGHSLAIVIKEQK